jgi:peptidoglycan/xylan/chitin deacetylase (PgdA/CDA1 family)
LSIFHILFPLICFLFSPEEADTLSLFHGSRNEFKIALTFDACPSLTRNGYDSLIVQTLVDSGVPATFFLSGRWIVKHQRETKYLASIPNFELGNHSYSHPHCTMISDDSMKLQLQRTNVLLKKITGTASHLFRPPFGETDQRIEHIAENLGCSTIMYDLASGDPDSTISLKRLVRYVVSHTQKGSIIVMHVNGRGWHTAKALPEIIQSLRKKGFVFVKVSDLLAARIHKKSSPLKKK